ncbi:S8 family serine peptidase, partial [bacterium]|nr:S8 family serine peptidase [bacterium]
DLAFCTSGSYPTWNDLYNAMGEVGILSACATANANYNVDTQGDVPTSCSSPYVISVTNTTSTDAKNSGAGYGLTTIDLGAPGTSILSLRSTGSTGTMTGTSMSTPHVAGAVALMHAAASFGFYNYNTLYPDSGALALKEMLLDGTDPIAALQGITVTGGRLNLYNACLAISQYVGVNPTEPFVNLISAVSDDTTLGDADGAWRAGETIEAIVTLSNIGEDALNVQGVLSSADTNVTITDATADFGNIANGAQGDNSASTFAVHLEADAPLAHTIEFTLDVTADSGYVRQLNFTLDANPKVQYYLEDCESGAADWTHGVVTGATDQWHLSTEMTFSPTHAWKCGSTTTGTYASSQDAGLISPAILLSTQSELHFRHWMESETSTTYPDSAYDGGIVELSLNGGAYARITPVGNYPKTYRLTAGGVNPFTGPLPGVPCYGGAINWAEAVFDLSAYADSSARFRFRFSSDVATTREGWYVDDIRVVGAPEIVEIVQVSDLVILPVGNNAQLFWSPSSTPSAVYQIYLSNDVAIEPVDGVHLGATSDTTYTHTDGFLTGEFGAYQIVVTLP